MRKREKYLKVLGLPGFWFCREMKKERGKKEKEDRRKDGWVLEEYKRIKNK